MKIIGLTGPSGTGKSTVAVCAREIGYFVIDCDKISAKVSKFDSVLNALEKEFKNVVINGVLDRSALAKKAFKNKASTEKLNNIMLPVIIKEVRLEIKKAESEGNKYCILDAPTLYESGLNTSCDFVIAVLASREKRKQRIISRDALSLEAAENRLNAAKSDEFYKARADYVIYNNFSFEEYKKEIFEILNRER